MADGVSESPQIAVRAGEAHESHESHEDDTRERIHRHSRKFQAVTAMLVGFAIGAVNILAIERQDFRDPHGCSEQNFNESAKSEASLGWGIVLVVEFD